MGEVMSQTQRYDVVIDEIMSRPSPRVGLPMVKWIELKNTSAVTINLLGWRLGRGNIQSGYFPAYLLKPDSFVIVCAAASASVMAAFGPAISVTRFPALNISGELIYLLSPENKVIHSVQYADSWYQDELKKAGGWTLEMIDTKNPCSGIINWKASKDIKGGTPGKKNSINGINSDRTSPRLLQAFASDSLHVTLLFDEPLDSLKGATVNNYSISDGIGAPQSAVVVAPVFNRVRMKLQVPISRDKVYTVTASVITDCAGNIIGSKNHAKFGITSAADSLNVVINEVLFNPLPGGVDYVELYNRSEKILNAKHLYVANRNSSGIISAITPISTDSLLFFPGDYLLISIDPLEVMRQYVTLNPDAFLALSSMPSFPIDKGDVIILNMQGKIIDEVKYSDKWHFQLIANTQGVSLERIDYNGPSIAENFHSAATSVGFGTPGYKNSQSWPEAQASGDISVSPEVFSPDNDGVDDFANIDYHFPTPGFMANITVYDANGRPVRYLQRNALCGTKGVYRWDGLGDKMQKLPVGIYIIVSEVFDTNGRTRQFKNYVVLARRLG